MIKTKKGKIVRKTLFTTMLVASLASFSGCAKKVDCDIEGQHIHVYVDQNSNLKKYEKSEREHIGSYQRTDEYLEMTDMIKTVVKKDLLLLKDNEDYILREISKYQPKKQVYEYDYIYGWYYGYGSYYDYNKNKYEYGYKRQQGWHHEWVWNDMNSDEYTENEIRDITYSYKLYKVNEDGTIESKVFETLENVETGYDYFSDSDFIVEVIGDSYYMTPPVK